MHKHLMIVSTLLALGAAPLSAQTRPATGPAKSGAANTQAETARPTAADDQDFSALREARIAILKGALQLRPDQQQYWPALEAAIRARSEARERRIKQIEARMNDPAATIDPIQMLKNRAEALAARADSLKKVADAWQPLYTTLDADQKRRMVIVTALVLREVRNAVESRMMDEEEETDDF